ncbi:MAG: type II toxin-antitoxin system RelE/ParE family toxin [Armatimonadetes bacterium]|nr:type II toxin-antitoxin system RelE/ParE family toxin [Armatimonadota bacterium]
MKYQVKTAAGAARDIKKLPEQIAAQILSTIDKLAYDPRPPGAKKMESIANCYRVHEGVYRIVYVIEDDILKINVVTVGHRKEVYRRLQEKIRHRAQ